MAKMSGLEEPVRVLEVGELAEDFLAVGAVVRLGPQLDIEEQEWSRSLGARSWSRVGACGTWFQ